MSWRDRFGMKALPLPRGAAGESFFDGDPHYERLARAFAWLAAEPGIGVVTGEPGVGKTAAMRHLMSGVIALPRIGRGGRGRPIVRGRQQGRFEPGIGTGEESLTAPTAGREWPEGEESGPRGWAGLRDPLRHRTIGRRW